MKPQGTLKGMQVKEAGESECLSVMEWIQVEAAKPTLPDSNECRLPVGVYS